MLFHYREITKTLKIGNIAQSHSNYTLNVGKDSGPE